jgi:hypothetical protein
MLAGGISTTTLITVRDSDTLPITPRTALIEADRCEFRRSTMLRNSSIKVCFGSGSSCRRHSWFFTAAARYAEQGGRIRAISSRSVTYRDGTMNRAKTVAWIDAVLATTFTLLGVWLLYLSQDAAEEARLTYGRNVDSGDFAPV